jgi:hypothetical protein
VPKLTNIRELAGRSAEPWLDKDGESFVSPDRSREIVLTKPDELRMGLTYWSRTRLLENGGDVTDQHPKLLEALGHGPIPLSCFVPWDATSGRLLMTSTSRTGFQLGIFMYDVALRHVAVAKQVDWSLQSSSWSPAATIALLVSAEAADAVSATGQVLWSHPFPKQRRPAVLAGWTRSGRYCFWDRGGPKPSIDFVDSTDGRLADQIVVDPEVLLPYDAQSYRELKRDRWVLNIGRGTRGIGRLLDEWSRARFDPGTQQIELGVYRPTSEVRVAPPLAPDPTHAEAELGCSAELKWVALDVNE